MGDSFGDAGAHALLEHQSRFSTLCEIAIRDTALSDEAWERLCDSGWDIYEA
jgi:hypothetical protein